MSPLHGTLLVLLHVGYNSSPRLLALPLPLAKVHQHPLPLPVFGRLFLSLHSRSYSLNLQPPSHTLCCTKPQGLPSAAVLQSPVMPNTRRSYSCLFFISHTRYELIRSESSRGHKIDGAKLQYSTVNPTGNMFGEKHRERRQKETVKKSSQQMT